LLHPSPAFDFWIAPLPNLGFPASFLVGLGGYHFFEILQENQNLEESTVFTLVVLVVEL
jgi:hypothetical protein